MRELQNKIYFIFFAVIMLFISCRRDEIFQVSDDYEEDSLVYYMSRIKETKNPIRAMYINKSFNKALNLKYDIRIKETLFNLLMLHYKDKNWKYFKEYSAKLLERATKFEDSSNIGRCYRYVGAYFKNNTNKYDSAFYYYVKAERVYLNYDKKEYANILLNKGIVQCLCDDFLGAELSLLKGYSIFKKTNDYNRIYETLNQLSVVYVELGNYTKALEYGLLALDVAENELDNENAFIQTSLNNVGFIYLYQNDLVKAENYYVRALKDIKIKNTHPELYSNLLDNFAYCKFKRNQSKNVLENFNSSLKIRDSLRDYTSVVMSKIHLSEYFESKNIETAIKNSSEALDIARKIKNPSIILIALKNAAKIDKSKVVSYNDEYIKINDSLKIVERNFKDRLARIQLETDEIAQEKETAIRQKWVQTAIIATVLLIVILLFIIYRQRSHQKELLLLQNQQEANAEIYRLMLHQQTQTEEARQQEKQRIALELHDNVMNKLASSRFNLFPLTQNTDQTIQQHASQQAQTLKEIEDEIRSLTHELAQPQATDRNSFEQLLQAFIADQNRRADIQFTLELDPAINWDTVASEAKMHLYRIVQEGVHNIRKHAEATKVSLRTVQTEDSLCLEISDNGKGFDTTTAHKGIGLQNMQNRMKSVGGTVSIHSHPGKTIIQVCIPSQTKN